MLRCSISATVLALLCFVVTGLQFPIERELEIAPGTTMGFEYSEENLFEFLSFSGTVDCVSYSFNSTQPMNAALFWQYWWYIEEHANNFTQPPLDQGLVPGSLCSQTQTCTIEFTEGNLPRVDDRRRSGLSAVPYTVVFWYDKNNTQPANVSLIVDGPCYTGEVEKLYFPDGSPHNSTANNQTGSS